MKCWGSQKLYKDSQLVALKAIKAEQNKTNQGGGGVFLEEESKVLNCFCVYMNFLKNVREVQNDKELSCQGLGENKDPERGAQHLGWLLSSGCLSD